MVGPRTSAVIQMENVSNCKIGQRVKCNGYRGTVMYIGEVPPTSGIWLGIDWDEPTRGKHDGTHEGHKYFKTRHPTSGSFVRPGKIDFGQSCVSAICSRYSAVENAEIDEDNWAMVQKEMNARFLEMVGLDKINRMQGEFGKLKQVILDDYAVNGAGLPHELKNMCPNIEELGLSRNLLSSWEEVAEITRQLLHLRVLNISENQLLLPNEPEELKDSFSSLEHLIAGLLEYSWDEMLICFKMWPHIKALQVPNNNFVLLKSPPSDMLYQLTFIDLDGNPIDSWAEINKLGKLPRLEMLHVSNTGLINIYFPSEELGEKTELFPSLKKLCITDNKINEWKPICELDKLQSLVNLKMVGNPVLLQENIATCRQLTIARIGSLKKLNGVDVAPDERKGAEYDYLKRHGKVWLDLLKTQDKEQLQYFIKEHPRYPYLIQKFGAPDEGELKVLPTTLKSKMISVELFSPDHESKTFNKMLPRNMMVQKLVGLAQKMFSTGNEFPKLAYISSKRPGVEVPLENEYKTLDFNSVEDGDQITVRW